MTLSANTIFCCHSEQFSSSTAASAQPTLFVQTGEDRTGGDEVERRLVDPCGSVLDRRLYMEWILSCFHFANVDDLSLPRLCRSSFNLALLTHALLLCASFFLAPYRSGTSVHGGFLCYSRNPCLLYLKQMRHKWIGTVERSRSPRLYTMYLKGFGFCDRSRDKAGGGRR